MFDAGGGERCGAVDLYAVIAAELSAGEPEGAAFVHAADRVGVRQVRRGRSQAHGAVAFVHEQLDRVGATQFEERLSVEQQDPAMI